VKMERVESIDSPGDAAVAETTVPEACGQDAHVDLGGTIANALVHRLAERRAELVAAREERLAELAATDRIVAQIDGGIMEMDFLMGRALAEQ
jgi:hypothetical protein